MIDKALFEDYIPYRHYYLTVTNRGCVRKCAFCAENFKERWESEHQLGPFMRDTSVDKVIAEFRTMRERYGLRYIDIKNNVLSGSKKWTLEFLRRYREEIGLPFRIMGYPRLLTREVTQALQRGRMSPHPDGDRVVQREDPQGGPAASGDQRAGARRHPEHGGRRASATRPISFSGCPGRPSRTWSTRSGC